MRYLLESLGDITEILVHWFQIILFFLYVYQSSSWHTSFMKSEKLKDISSFGWDISLNFYRHIPGMLVHFFKIILNFLYVFQSVNWLTSLLELDKYGDISCSGWDIFLKIFGDIPRMFSHYFQIIINFSYVSQSVNWLTSLLKLDKCRDISCSGWDIFLKIFGDILGMFLNNSKIILNFLYVSKSVCLLTSILKLDKCRDIYSSGFDIFLKFFGDIPGMLVHYFQIILNFLYVSQSVCLLTSLPNLD